MQSVHQGQGKPSVTECERHRQWCGKTPLIVLSCSELVQFQQDAHSLVEFLASPIVESCQPLWPPATVCDHSSSTKFFSFILSRCPIDWLFSLKNTDFSSFCLSKTTFCLLFFMPLPQTTWWRNYKAYRKAKLWEMTDVWHLSRLSAWCFVAPRLRFSL